MGSTHAFIGGAFCVASFGPIVAGLWPVRDEPIAAFAPQAQGALAAGVQLGLAPISANGAHVAVFAAPPHAAEFDVFDLYRAGAWLVLRAEPLGLCRSPTLDAQDTQQ